MVVCDTLILKQETLGGRLVYLLAVYVYIVLGILRFLWIMLVQVYIHYWSRLYNNVQLIA